ncbi:MAG: T9SS type A sorting domain-containing protein [bacterium]
MKRVLQWMFLIGLLAAFSHSYASIGPSSGMPSSGQMGKGSSLDEVCTIDYIGLVNGGGNPGTVYWPSGALSSPMGMLQFTNSCTPDEILYTYCLDISHWLYQDPYCVEMADEVIDPLYPEQFPAIGYIMTWYPSASVFEDDAMQMALWKLSPERNSSSPNYGVPFYHTDAGRGYPSLDDLPAYPYVNTLYHTDSLLNDAGNDEVLDALGVTDGIAKNVILAGDQLLTNATFEVVGADAILSVEVQLVRGPKALSVGNLSLGGVKLLISTDGGILSAAEAFTDLTGQAEFTVTQPLGSPAITVQVCSRGLWPKGVVPCEGIVSQHLVVSSPTLGAVDSVCVTGTFDWPLPAELTSFEARASGNGIVLTWRSASESDVSYWEIERRTAGSSAYAGLAQVSAANTPSGHTYTYADLSVQHGMVYEYRLVDVDINGVRTVHDDVVRSASISTSGGALLSEYRLADNYPNPFNPETHIAFTLPQADEVSLKVFDITGKVVATLVEGSLAAGEHRATFRGDNLASGLYFYTLTAGSFSQTKKMILMK